MQELKNHTSTKWWIAHNNDYSVIHHGKVEVGQIVTSGQQIIDIYDTEQEWLDFLATKNINSNQPTL